MPQAAYCKLCTEKNLRTIDGEHGFFVTVVPKTRAEVAAFTDAVLAGDVRWEEILRKRPDRDEKAFDVIECASAPTICAKGLRSTGTDRARTRSAMNTIATSALTGR
jgi:hypothetical protein